MYKADWDRINALERKHEQEIMGCGAVIGLILFIIGVGCLILVLCTQAQPSEESALERIVAAIYLAEGGNKAVKPFGILSVKCEGYNECRQICRNTVVNTRIRYQSYRREGGREFKDFISYLANRYAPRGVLNDPTDLNRNWERLVRYFLNKKEKSNG